MGRQPCGVASVSDPTASETTPAARRIGACADERDGRAHDELAPTYNLDSDGRQDPDIPHHSSISTLELWEKGSVPARQYPLLL
jgi:hypothetical protein